MLNKMGRSLCIYMILGLLLFRVSNVTANDLEISGIDISSLPEDRLQIQLEMNGAAVEPKVFHTENPARIALDFSGVKNAMSKKMIPVNQREVSSIYVAEAADRVRVVVNLTESTPFETKVVGNKVLLTLNQAKIMTPAALKTPTARSITPGDIKSANSVARALIPEQAISRFDFRRGDKGEGRILVFLANPNTIVNSKQEAGKVIINLLNTRLPENLAKRLDVSDFATPVKYIDTASLNQETTITVTTQNDLYDYSLFQTEGLLTIEFRPLTSEEKEALTRSRAKYTGDRLSLNFQDIEIRSVIAILAEFTGQNIVAGDDVTGTITLKLDDVPWDEALDFIMMTKGLEKYESDNVILVAPVGKIKDYKEQQEATATVVEQLDPLVTEYISINYAKAENFRNLLRGFDSGVFGSCWLVQSGTGGAGQTGQSGQMGQMGQMGQSGQMGQTGQAGAQAANKFGLLSPRGTAIIDARTNTLIVRETKKRLEEIKKLVRKLDVPVRQVLIESRVAIVTSEFTRNLGVKFGVSKIAADIGSGKSFAIGGTGTQGNTITGAGNPPGAVGIPGTQGNVVGAASPNNLLVDLGAAAIGGFPPGALGMTLARGADYVLNLELQALQADQKAEIISNPRVMTMDRCTAVMSQGTQIPVTTPPTANNPATTTYIPAVLELNVTPQITPSGSIVMNLLVKKDAQNQDVNAVSGNPGIDTREVRTSVLVEDGETVVLGGVYENDNRTLKNKIPFFADLPAIGFLFTNSSVDKTNNELLIFVTPKIVNDNTASH